MKKTTRAELNMFSNMARCRCGKPVYDKKGAITARNHRMKTAHIRLRAYPCDICGGWHLTSKL